MKIEIDTENGFDMKRLETAFSRYLQEATPLEAVMAQSFTEIPPQPLRLGTIVRDSNGVVVIKFWAGDADECWTSVIDSSEEYTWEELAHPVETLSEGVPDEVWKGPGR